MSAGMRPRLRWGTALCLALCAPGARAANLECRFCDKPEVCRALERSTIPLRGRSFWESSPPMGTTENPTNPAAGALFRYWVQRSRSGE
jgi:hypothetical protein